MSRFRRKIAELESHRPLTEPPPRYREWLEHCFGRLVPYEEIGIDLHDPDLSEPFEVADDELVALFEVGMRRSGADLAGFSDEVVGQGLSYLLNSAFSNFAYRIRTAEVPRERKANAIGAMRHLYRDVLSPRCRPALGHLAKAGGYDSSALAFICYMLWDVCPLGYWPDDEGDGPVARAALAVMADALESSNPAVVESGLHGLGHAHGASPAAVERAIDAFLARRSDLRPELIAYARAARSGCIQ